jgi:hypothetical protein
MNNSADSLATWDKNEIGAMITLMTLSEPDGTQYTGLTALASPTGAFDGLGLGIYPNNGLGIKRNYLAPKNEIGAMITLMALSEPDGMEYTGLTALASPTGAFDGLSRGIKSIDLAPLNGRGIKRIDLAPKNIACPDHVTPVLASFCCNSHMLLPATSDDTVGVLERFLVTHWSPCMPRS